MPDYSGGYQSSGFDLAGGYGLADLQAMMLQLLMQGRGQELQRGAQMGTTPQVLDPNRDYGNEINEAFKAYEAKNGPQRLPNGHAKPDVWINVAKSVTNLPSEALQQAYDEAAKIPYGTLGAGAGGWKQAFNQILQRAASTAVPSLQQKMWTESQTGYIGGKPTMSREEMEAQRRFREAEIMGYYPESAPSGLQKEPRGPIEFPGGGAAPAPGHPSRGGVVVQPGEGRGKEQELPTGPQTWQAGQGQMQTEMQQQSQAMGQPYGQPASPMQTFGGQGQGFRYDPNAPEPSPSGPWMPGGGQTPTPASRQKTLAREQYETGAGQQMMNLLASLRGPENYFQYANALSNAEGSPQLEFARRLASGEQIPAFQQWGQTRPATLGGLVGLPAPGAPPGQQAALQQGQWQQQTPEQQQARQAALQQRVASLQRQGFDIGGPSPMGAPGAPQGGNAQTYDQMLRTLMQGQGPQMTPAQQAAAQQQRAGFERPIGGQGFLPGESSPSGPWMPGPQRTGPGPDEWTPGDGPTREEQELAYGWGSNTPQGAAKRQQLLERSQQRQAGRPGEPSPSAPLPGQPGEGRGKRSVYVPYNRRFGGYNPPDIYDQGLPGQTQPQPGQPPPFVPGHQINVSQWGRVLPSQKKIQMSALEAQGVVPEDWLASMRRAAPQGQAGAVRRWR